MLVEKEWCEYFEGLLKVEEDREDEIVGFGRKNRVHSCLTPSPTGKPT